MNRPSKKARQNHVKPTLPVAVSIGVRKHCPTCKTDSLDEEWTLKISGKEPVAKIAGDYCLLCYLRFLAANVPRLEIAGG